MNKPVILCMFSGGLDSTGVLWKLLTAPEYQSYRIHVHHINMVNIERRGRAEKKACMALLQAFRNMGHDFDYTENTIEANFLKAPLFTRFMFDSDVTHFLAANIFEGRRAIRHVAFGLTKDDVFAEPEKANANLVARWKRSAMIFQAALAMTPEAERPRLLRPVINLTKKEIWQQLPESVRSHIWWCRRPVWLSENSFRSCEKCKTCKQMQTLLAQPQAEPIA